MWKLSFQVKNVPEWEVLSASHSYQVLSRNVKEKVGNIKELDFIPKGGSIEDGEFVIINKLTPIGQLTIERV